jgi:hypothetical protein
MSTAIHKLAAYVAKAPLLKREQLPAFNANVTKLARLAEAEAMQIADEVERSQALFDIYQLTLRSMDHVPSEWLRSPMRHGPSFTRSDRIRAAEYMRKVNADIAREMGLEYDPRDARTRINNDAAERLNTKEKT